MNISQWNKVSYYCTLAVLILVTFFTGALFTLPMGIAAGQTNTMTVPFQLGQAEQIAINADRLLKIESQLSLQDKRIEDCMSRISVIQGVGMAIGGITALLSALGLLAKHKP